MNVLDLNNKNIKQFNSIMKGNCIILFHHPQCGHCIELRPAWEKVKQMNADKPINIMEIESDMLSKINHPIKNSVRGFPQIVRLENGKVMSEFNKLRNVENLNKFVNQNVIKRKNINRSLNVTIKKKRKRNKKKTKARKKKRLT